MRCGNWLDANTCCRARAMDGRRTEECHWNMEEGEMNLEHSEADYESAAAAKAAMRDEVYRLRKIHLPE